MSAGGLLNTPMKTPDSSSSSSTSSTASHALFIFFFSLTFSPKTKFLKPKNKKNVFNTLTKIRIEWKPLFCHNSKYYWINFAVSLKIYRPFQKWTSWDQRPKQRYSATAEYVKEMCWKFKIIWNKKKIIQCFIQKYSFSIFFFEIFLKIKNLLKNQYCPNKLFLACALIRKYNNKKID